MPIECYFWYCSISSQRENFPSQRQIFKNEYGVTVTNRKQVEFTDDEGNISYEWRDVPVENPDYDPKQDYVSRSERPEWNTVGLLGQIYTNVEKIRYSR